MLPEMEEMTFDSEGVGQAEAVLWGLQGADEYPACEQPA